MGEGPSSFATHSVLYSYCSVVRNVSPWGDQAADSLLNKQVTGLSAVREHLHYERPTAQGLFFIVEMIGNAIRFSQLCKT